MEADNLGLARFEIANARPWEFYFDTFQEEPFSYIRYYSFEIDINPNVAAYVEGY